DAELAITGGELVLAPSGAAETRASLSVRGAVRPPGATTRTSLVVQGTLAIARDGAVLSVQSVELLTVRPGVSLAAVTLADTGADAPAVVHVSPQKLGLTVNLPRGSRAGRPPFELLPGWSIGADAAVHGHASLDIAPPSPGRVSAAAIVGMQLVVETELDASAPEPGARPPALGAVLTYRLRASAAPALALRLTGEYRAQSVLRWASEDGQSRLHHTVRFLMRQATLPDLVSDDAAASFLTVSAGAVIELPCLATHSIVDDADGAPRELLTWVAAQRLRIGSVTWFTGDVLLRAANRPSVLEPTAQREKLTYQDPRSIETGFVGALGAALNTALTGAREPTMVIEASEAFWLAPAPAGDARRSSVALWRSERQRLDGTPSSDASFELDRGATWLRLPMPFLTDTRGVVRTAAQTTPALAALLDNATQPPPTPRPRWARWHRIDRSTEILGREELARRGSLDRYSRSHAPLVPGYGGGMDQVVLRTVAYATIVPYTLPLTGFAPGSLIFRTWRPSSGTEAPFGATLEVLNALIDPARAIRCTAATELVPDTAGNGRPYLLASPLSELTLTEDAATAATAAAAELRQRVVLEVWLPDDHPGSDGAPALAARAVFHVPVAVDDDWEAVLSERDPAQTMRQRPRLWVAQLEDTLAGAALLRATALDAGPLPAKRYFLLGARALPIVRASGPRGRLGVAAPAQPDLRYRALAAPIQDPLMTGPDCLAGRVYHEERSWYRAPRPTPDNDAPGPIARFEAQPDSIARGEEVTFHWTIDSEAILVLEVPGHPPLDVSGRDHATVHLEVTTLVGLRALDDHGATVGYREAAVVVAVPVAGSAVGLAYKLAGTAAGPRHRSRRARTDASAGGQRWLELTRDVVFGDVTRPPAERPQREPGWYLPPARVLAWESADLGRSLAGILATRTTAIYASGRAGALVRVRAALLHETSDGAVHRSASFPHALRHPRPVHLPEELRAVCAAAPVAVPAPFRATELTWRDPLYDRRLFAVGQSGAIGRLTLALDRSRSGAVDVLYPEVVLDLADLGAAWSIALRVQLVRDGRVVDELACAIGPAGLTRAGATAVVAGAEGPQPRAGKRRWVLELGLAQPEAVDGGFGATPQDKDELLAIAELRASPSMPPEEPVSLTAVIRAQSTWPQPQNAFAVVRSRTGAPDALVAFGWLVQPVIVRREDRFRGDAWTGMFRHRHVAPGDDAADARFTIQTITSYGESS
ncbi:MAG TPA: hypothetical protein VGD80_19825, partial [Kofleriaceae bacterium]